MIGHMQDTLRPSSAAIRGLLLVAAAISSFMCFAPARARAQLGEVKPGTLSYEYDPAMELEDAPGHEPGAKLEGERYHLNEDDFGQRPSWPIR